MTGLKAAVFISTSIILLKLKEALRPLAGINSCGESFQFIFITGPERAPTVIVDIVGPIVSNAVSLDSATVVSNPDVHVTVRQY